MRELIYTGLFLTVTLRFTCGERKPCLTIKSLPSSKYHEHDCLQSSYLLFKSLLTALIAENSYIWLGFYLSF